MAGIGFELKKLFRHKNLAAAFRAYSYASVICAGPMLLGVILLLGIQIITKFFGAAKQEQDLLVCMITYTLLFSLTVTSYFSMTVTRHIADKLYEGKREAVYPALIGSSIAQLAVGEPIFIVFLFFCGAKLVDCVLMLLLFAELIVTWNQMSFLTAIKNYKGLMITFAIAVAIAFLVGFVLLWLGCAVVESILLAVTIGYGFMAFRSFVLLREAFPRSAGGPFDFLCWIEDYRLLAFTGLFVNIGLFAHLVIMWASDIGVQVLGLFYGAPYYDVPALLAFMTILVTTVNFVVSVEVNFYPKYRNYYALYNDNGNNRDIVQAESEMLEVMRSEILMTAIVQLLATMLAIAVESAVLDWLPLGFNELMHGYFRTLCAGYGMYACGNVCMLLMLYFTDYRGAFVASAIFAASTSVLSVLQWALPHVYYGVGFAVGSAVFFAASLIGLNRFTKNLPYHILSQQDVVAVHKRGALGRLAETLNKMAGETKNA